MKVMKLATIFLMIAAACAVVIAIGYGSWPVLWLMVGAAVGAAWNVAKLSMQLDDDIAAVQRDELLRDAEGE